MRRKKDFLPLLTGLFIVLLIIGGIWFNVKAPCSWFGYGPAKDVPARCLTFVEK